MTAERLQKLPSYVSPTHDRAVVRIAGPDAHALLQNVVTLDMDEVDRHGSGYGALLTPQGKILWDFVLHKAAGWICGGCAGGGGGGDLQSG